MTTVAVIPAPSTKVSLINTLITLGAALGSTFLGGPAGTLITTAAAATENIISNISAAKTTAALTGTSTTTVLIVPIFTSVLKATLAVALAEGKISVQDANTLGEAVTALGVEDTIAQTIEDYTTIGPISTV
jgi:hypothetical protein